MGGYGFYVWGSFGMTLACLAVEVWLLRRRRVSLMKRLVTLRGRVA